MIEYGGVCGRLDKSRSGGSGLGLRSDEDFSGLLTPMIYDYWFIGSFDVLMLF